MLCKRKTSVKETTFTMSFLLWDELWEETKENSYGTARTMSHKNLLTSLKFYNFSFYFLFIIFYDDPWWLEKQHSLYPFTLSEFLSREMFSFPVPLSALPEFVCEYVSLETKIEKRKKG